MSDGVGPFLTVLWGCARRVRGSEIRVSELSIVHMPERYAARMAWSWDALPDLDGIAWDWLRRMG